MKRCILSVYSLDGELLDQETVDGRWAGLRSMILEWHYGRMQPVHLIYGSEVFSI